MGGEQGGNNGNKSPVQQTLDEGASSPKSVPRPPSPPPCPATKTPTIHQMINSYEPKMKSSDVDLFLKVLKNKPKWALASSKESSDIQVLKKVPDEKSLTHTSFQRQKDEQISMFSLDEVPDKYEHDKPFCFWWQLNEGLPELMRLHGWIMHAMEQGIHTITANVPKWVFNSSLERKVAIDFPDLHVMFRRDKLDINLVTIWSM
jgi:hypothetical protein